MRERLDDAPEESEHIISTILSRASPAQFCEPPFARYLRLVAWHELPCNWWGHGYHRYCSTYRPQSNDSGRRIGHVETMNPTCRDVRPKLLAETRIGRNVDSHVFGRSIMLDLAAGRRIPPCRNQTA